MKRKILIIMTATALTLNLNGCSKLEVEKKPITIEDSSENLNSVFEKEENDSTLSLKDTNTNTTEPSDIKESDNEKVPEKNETMIDSELNGKEVDLIVEVEGTTETVKGKIHVSNLGYQMVYDMERYKLTSEDGLDSFFAENPDPTVYPYVFLNVSRSENTSMNDYVDKLEKEINDQKISYQKIEYKEIGEGNYKAIYFRTQAGYNWDSIIREYYILEDGEDIILIETQYFLEAQEGHGARFLSMLNTFQIQ